MVVFVDDIPVFEFLFGVFALVVVVVDDDDDDDDDDSQLLWVVFDVGAARSNIVLFLFLVVDRSSTLLLSAQLAFVWALAWRCLWRNE